MKKRFRKIVVDGLEYAWTLQNGCDGDGGNFIKIFQNRQLIYEDHEGISGLIDITPRIIVEIIKENNL